MARSLRREASVRNARPMRISAPSRSRQRGLVAAQPRLAQIVGAQRLVERLGGELAADQAVVDAAAGRRLDQSGGVADGEQARAVGARDRAERQDLQARLGPVAAGDPNRARSRAANVPEARAARARRTSGRAAGTAGPSRSNGTTQAKPPGATSRPRWTSTLSGSGERLLELRALHEGARHAEPELPVEAIVRAAREDARARLDRAPPPSTRDRDADVGDRDRAHARAAAQLGAGGAARVGQRLIEQRAIDDRRLRRARRRRGRSCRRPRRTRRVRGAEDRCAAEGRIRRRPRGRGRRCSAPARRCRRAPRARRRRVRAPQAARAAISPAGPAPMTTTSRTDAAQYLRPRTSHVPCTLIQNDRRINRTSSHHERRCT